MRRKFIRLYKFVIRQRGNGVWGGENDANVHYVGCVLVAYPNETQFDRIKGGGGDKKLVMS